MANAKPAGQGSSKEATAAARKAAKENLAKQAKQAEAAEDAELTAAIKANPSATSVRRVNGFVVGKN